MGIAQIPIPSPQIPKSSFVCECVSKESTSMKSVQQRGTRLIVCIKPDPSVSLIPTHIPLAMRISEKKKNLEEIRPFYFQLLIWAVLAMMQVLIDTCTIQCLGKNEEFAVPI